MASTIQNKNHDNAVLAGLQGSNSKGDQTTYLAAIKTHLDNNCSQFKGPNGIYPWPLVAQAMNIVANKGK